MHDLLSAARAGRADVAALTQLAHDDDPSLMARLEAAGIASAARRHALRAQLRALPSPSLPPPPAPPPPLSPPSAAADAYAPSPMRSWREEMAYRESRALLRSLARPEEPVAAAAAAAVGGAARGEEARAARARREEAAEEALDTDEPPPGGWTERHLLTAAREGRGERMARMLLRGGLDLSWGNEAGETALHAAAERGHTECVRQLLRAGAAVDAASAYGGTPLYGAVFWGHEASVALLLQAKADATLLSSNAKKLSEIAAHADYRGIERLLRRAEARGEGGEGEGAGEAEEVQSDMPPHLLRWVEEEMGRLGNERHLSLMHWLFMLPTCHEKEIEGYMSMYLGERSGQAEFAYEFARRKYEWREKGLQSVEEARLKAECDAGVHDAGDEAAGRFSRTFTERTLGLALNVDRTGRIFVNKVMPGSVAGKRGLKVGTFLVGVGETSTEGAKLKDVQHLVANAARPIQLHFEGSKFAHNGEPLPKAETPLRQDEDSSERGEG